MSDLAQYRERLALEVMGWIFDDEEGCYIYGEYQKSIEKDDFCPDEDVAQAIHCLEAMHRESWHILRFSAGRWSVEILPVNGIHGHAMCASESLPAAIVTAIAKALSWPSTDKDETR